MARKGGGEEALVAQVVANVTAAAAIRAASIRKVVAEHRKAATPGKVPPQLDQSTPRRGGATSPDGRTVPFS